MIPTQNFKLDERGLVAPVRNKITDDVDTCIFETVNLKVNTRFVRNKVISRVFYLVRDSNQNCLGAVESFCYERAKSSKH